MWILVLYHSYTSLSENISFSIYYYFLLVKVLFAHTRLLIYQPPDRDEKEKYPVYQSHLKLNVKPKLTSVWVYYEHAMYTSTFILLSPPVHKYN